MYQSSFKILLVIHKIFHYFSTMSFVNLRKLYYWLGAITLFCQVLGLIFCGDADCLQGGSDADCAALICGLLGKHAATNPASNDSANDSCQCYCHSLITLPQITLNAVHLATTPFHAGEIRPLVSLPVRSIYHPPLV
jgi:hypothetical protein